MHRIPAKLKRTNEILRFSCWVVSTRGKEIHCTEIKKKQMKISESNVGGLAHGGKKFTVAKLKRANEILRI